MGGQALMDHDEVAELEGAGGPDEMRAAMSAMAVLTALLLLAGLVSAVVIDRRADDVSIATLQRAAARVDEARSLRMTFRLDLGGGGFGLVADIDKATERARMTFDGPSGQAEAVLDGSRIYFTVPPQHQANTGGKPCVVVTMPADQPASSAMPTANEGKAMLDYLAGATGEVRDLGPEDLDGLATHKYVVDVDLAEVISRMPASQRAGAEGLKGMTGLATIPYEVWLDDDGVARQVRVKVAAGDFQAVSTVRFDPSDKPLTIEIPADGACAPAPDALAALHMVGAG